MTSRHGRLNACACNARGTPSASLPGPALAARAHGSAIRDLDHRAALHAREQFARVDRLRADLARPLRFVRAIEIDHDVTEFADLVPRARANCRNERADAADA